MKAIINGKRYNAETAVLIGEGGNIGTVSRSDFRAWRAGLYRTKGGRYFLAGKGGPMTMFARCLPDGSRSGGEKIIPLTEDEAREWAEKNLAPDEVEAHFGDRIEDA